MDNLNRLIRDSCKWDGTIGRGKDDCIACVSIDQSESVAERAAVNKHEHLFGVCGADEAVSRGAVIVYLNGKEFGGL